MPDGSGRSMADQILESQIAALRAAIDAASSKQDANHQALRTELTGISRDTSEIRLDIKGLDKRVGAVETDVAYMKGQRSGGNAMYTMIIGAAGLFIGVAGTAFAFVQSGR